MDDNDLRDCFAMFALVGIIFKIPIEEVDVSAQRDEYGKSARGAYSYADAMMEARKPQEETGIVKARKKKEAL
jgi:hypothetical protein